MRSRELLANERKLLNQMTPWLREEVISTINLKILKGVTIFDKMARMVNGQELINRVMYIMGARVREPPGVWGGRGGGNQSAAASHL